MNMLKKKLIKIQFVNAKTQFENAKTQKTAQVVAWTCLDRRTKKSPVIVMVFKSVHHLLQSCVWLNLPLTLTTRQHGTFWSRSVNVFPPRCLSTSRLTADTTPSSDSQKWGAEPLTPSSYKRPQGHSGRKRKQLLQKEEFSYCV